jgi:uncharacterized repeat protein (TIGR03803 family)
MLDDSTGTSPYVDLTQGNDGSLYGATATGGSHDNGNIFRVSLAAHLMPLTPIGNSWRASFSGLAGDTYAVQRGTNLSGTWTTLTNIIVGPDGLGQHVDNSPPSTMGFYRIRR